MCNKANHHDEQEIKAEIQWMQRFYIHILVGIFTQLIHMHLCMIYIETRSSHIIQMRTARIFIDNKDILIHTNLLQLQSVAICSFLYFRKDRKKSASADWQSR